ncbi:hypothetical protein ElyMa_004434000 [Elysia marginata]|uniref:Uncharacterized protein n=1 Tax=Elysia marginata TaxID=1093978 RepID=A0AAV4HFX1_9GAST|nr:hypothetical protein ElyMa_004434000 [Elysia marginata]
MCISAQNLPARLEEENLIDFNGMMLNSPRVFTFTLRPALFPSQSSRLLFPIFSSANKPRSIEGVCKSCSSSSSSISSSRISSNRSSSIVVLVVVAAVAVVGREAVVVVVVMAFVVVMVVETLMVDTVAALLILYP